MTAAMLCFAVATTAAAQQIYSELDIEIAYIRHLGETLGMPDYAEYVLHQVKAKFPEAGPRLKVIQIEQQLAQGKFDEVQAIIDAEPDKEAPGTWAMRASKADYLFAYGRYDEAFGIYEALFKKYGNKPEESLLSFYRDSMYKYAQMLIRTGRNKKALDIYKVVLQLATNRETELRKNIKNEQDAAVADGAKAEKRQILFETAELAVNVGAELPATPAPAKGPAPAGSRAAYLAEGKKMCENILWEQDLWFAKGVALLARIRVLSGDVAGAHKLVGSYMSTVIEIDKALMEQGRQIGEDMSRLSPVAQCRFLTGHMLYLEAKKILDEAGDGELDKETKMKILELLIGNPKATPAMDGAYQEFVNVYVKYPGSNDAPEAMKLAEEIEETLVNRGIVKSMRKKITAEQRAEVSKRQFENARVSFNEQKYDEAITRYESILNQYPREIPDSIHGLSELARSYIALFDPADPATAMYELYADMVVGHLAETFCMSKGMEDAGNEIRAIAEAWATEKGNVAKREAVMDVFFTTYPEHTMSSPLIWTKADRAFKAEDYEAALTNFTRLATVYVKSPFSIEALARIADIHKKLGHVEDEIAAYSEIVKRLEAAGKPSFRLLTTRYQIAGAQRSLVKAEDLRSEDSEVAAAALKNLVTAARGFQTVKKFLDDPTQRDLYATTDDEKKGAKQLQEACGMGLAGSYSSIASLNLPEDKTATFRSEAIKAFEEVLKAFPESENGARILNQIGTLWTTAAAKAKDDAGKKQYNEQADAAFSRLAKAYPESEEAKLALFMQGRALMELGFASEGREKFVQMLKDTSKYRPFQMLAVGDALREGRQEDLALQAYDDAIARSADDEAVQMRASLGRAQVLAAQGKIDDAVVAFQKFVETYPKSGLVLDANLQLSRTASKQASETKETEERNRLFKVSVEAMKAVRKYYNGKSFEISKRVREAQEANTEVAQEDTAELARLTGKLAETDNDIGEILILDAKSASKEDEEEARGKAIGHFVGIMESADASVADSPERSGHVQKSFRTGIDLLLKSGEFSDVAYYAEMYLSTFPTGLYAAEIKLQLQEANARLQ